MSLPVAFSAHLAVPASANFSVPFDSRRLVNTYHVPIEVTEIRFTIRREGSGAAAGSAHLGLAIAARLSAGKDRITGDDAVPIAVIGSPLQAVSSEDTRASNGELELTATVPTNRDTWHQRWVLPRPLLIPPGQGLFAIIEGVQYGPGITFSVPANTTIDVGVIGRYVFSGMPRSRMVPYVSGYLWQSTAAGVIELRHPERIFGNPFDKPLAIQRFVGRQVFVEDSVGPGLDSVSLGNVPATPFGTTMMRVRAPFGYAGSRDPLPIDRLFDHQRRTWDCPHVLGVGDHWHFSIDSAVVGQEGHAVTHQPLISMIGHREEAL